MQIMSLVIVSQQMTIYLGFSLLIIGLIGNSLNVIIFSVVRRYRRTPCTFYFLISSITNNLFLFINLLSRIISSGYGNDLTRTSTIWCKTRQYFITTLSLFAFTCSCLTTIDQYLITSSNVDFRRLSHLKCSHRIGLISFVICCLHGIPVLVYFNISNPSGFCTNTNNLFAIYIPIYVLGLTCLIPILIMIFFGYLTYRNVHQRRMLVEQQIDRQLIRITLIQIFLVIFAIGPYGIYNIYSLITSQLTKTTIRLSIESFISTIVTLIVYIYYVVRIK